MKALDTNVLVRFLVQDDTKQVSVIIALLEKAEQERQQFYVSLLVVLEVIWVLESIYEVERDDLLGAVGELLSMLVISIESYSVVRAFINASRGNTLDLSDLLVGMAGLNAEFETTLTFDKKAAKSSYFEQL